MVLQLKLSWKLFTVLVKLIFRYFCQISRLALLWGSRCHQMPFTVWELTASGNEKKNHFLIFYFLFICQSFSCQCRLSEVSPEMLNPLKYYILVAISMIIDSDCCLEYWVWVLGLIFFPSIRNVLLLLWNHLG